MVWWEGAGRDEWWVRGRWEVGVAWRLHIIRGVKGVMDTRQFASLEGADVYYGSHSRK